MTVIHPLISHIRTSLREAADPEKAAPMTRYLRDKQPCLGVQAPRIMAICREGLLQYPVKGFVELKPIMEALWAGEYREERSAALRLARNRNKDLDQSALPLLQEMVISGQWWDLVDPIAVNLVGSLIRREPSLRPQVFDWIDSPDLWLRRTALLCQLKFKEETDWQVLSGMILKTAGEREFFIRKAIGWVLREFSKTNAETVRRFVATHTALLSPLSQREALKWLASRSD